MESMSKCINDYSLYLSPVVIGQKVE